MPLAADEVLLYPRRRRYIIVICIGFADTKIYSRRASIARPFIMVSSAAPDRADAITVSVSA